MTYKLTNKKINKYQFHNNFIFIGDQNWAIFPWSSNNWLSILFYAKYTPEDSEYWFIESLQQISSNQFLVKLVYSLVYVKPDNVGLGLSEVITAYLETRKEDEDVEEAYESLMEFLNYLEVTWVGKQLRGDHRTPPMHPVLLWNTYKEVLNSLPVTNNQVDSHNAIWNSTLSRHPNLWDILDRFQRLQASAETMLREDSLATNVPNVNKQKKQLPLVFKADLRKMIDLWKYASRNNIVRLFGDN